MLNGVAVSPDPWSLYALMLRSRLAEEAIAQLWKDGLISGEMHLGTGEEAVIAGVVSWLRSGDALALDHRGTAALLMRGVPLVPILAELLGKPEGLCGGRGGHMHLFSQEHLAACSGIVGASGPAAAGFALSAQYLRPGSVAVAFFGEGAMNQGMLLESLNLAAVRALPVLFVCKDDHWSIATESRSTTGGSLVDRARGLGVAPVEVDGLEVQQVWEAAGQAIQRARDGHGPTFLLARCVHLEGHFLGYQLLRTIRDPLKEMPALAGPLTRSLLRSGSARLGERLSGLRGVLTAVVGTMKDPGRKTENDPVVRARQRLVAAGDSARVDALEEAAGAEIGAAVSAVLGERSA